MRRYHVALIVLLGLAVAAPAPAQERPSPAPTPRAPRPPRPPSPPRDHDKAPFEEIDRRTLEVGNVTELDLSNISGDITVIPGGGSKAIIEVTKRGYGYSAEEAKQQLALVEVRLDVSPGGRGDIRTYYPERRMDGRRNFRSSVEYRVTTPPQTRIRAKSISGDLQVSKILGDLSLETISGNIGIDAAGRVSQAKSVSGDVEISGISGGEPLTAGTVSGTVRLRAIKVRRLDVNSVSGDVVARDVTCERADLQTISGDVEYTGPLARAGRYDLRSHSGDIRLIIPGDTGFVVEARSFSGAIRSRLEIQNEAAEPGEWGNGGRRGGHGPKRAVLRGTYKDGSAQVELTTFSGNIVIGK